MITLTLTAPRITRTSALRSAEQLALLTLLGAAILIPAGIAGVHGVLAGLTLAAAVLFVMQVSVATPLQTTGAQLALAGISIISAGAAISLLSAPACGIYLPTVMGIFYAGSAALWGRHYNKK